MSRLVERLVNRWLCRGPAVTHWDEERAPEDTRWWLNAIAEELEAALRARPTDVDVYDSSDVIRWLREQAKEGE